MSWTPKETPLTVWSPFANGVTSWGVPPVGVLADVSDRSTRELGTVLMKGSTGTVEVPVKVDAEGRLVIASDVTVNVSGVVADLGQIKQGPAGTEAWPVQLSGSKVAEQLTEADAVTNVLTFSAPVSAIEIYHDDAARRVFTVNGINLIVPPGYYRTLIGGVPSAAVTIPAGVACIVGRLV